MEIDSLRAYVAADLPRNCHHAEGDRELTIYQWPASIFEQAMVDFI